MGYLVEHTRQLAAFVVFVGISMVMLASIFLSGPSLEGRHFPVVKAAFAEFEPRSIDAIQAELYGDKVRDCSLVSFSVLVRVDGVWHRADVRINGYRPRMAARPTGMQSFGLWEIEPAGDRMKVELVHRCHALWYTTTKLGEWAVPF